MVWTRKGVNFNYSFRKNFKPFLSVKTVLQKRGKSVTEGQGKTETFIETYTKGKGPTFESDISISDRNVTYKKRLISEARESTFFFLLLVVEIWKSKKCHILACASMEETFFSVHISLYSDHWKFFESKTKSIFNRPIPRYYSIDDIHVTVTELQLTKTMSISLS